MPDITERVARAMCDEEAKVLGPMTMTNWDTISESRRGTFRNFARAAIEEVRKADEEMVEALTGQGG